MRLLLVRHPRPQVAPGICYGSTDLGVTSGQREQTLATLAVQLPRSVPLYSSPLRRCAELAALMPCASLNYDTRLAEMHFGDWEMRAWDDIPRPEIDAWAADVAGYHPGGGESVTQMAHRVAAFHAYVRRLPDREVIVVCHAGTMRLLQACHAGLPPVQAARHAARSPHHIPYGACLVLED